MIFKESCIEQKNTTFTFPNIIDFCIVYKLGAWLWDLNFDFTLKDCLFGGFKLAQSLDPDKCVYSGCGIGFDSRSENSLPDGSLGKKVIIFTVDMSLSVHIDNKKKDIWILGICSTQGLNDTR